MMIDFQWIEKNLWCLQSCGSPDFMPLASSMMHVFSSNICCYKTTDFFLHFFSFLIVINVRVGKGRKQWSSWHGSPVAKNYTVTVAELNDDCFPGPLDGVLYMPSWHFVVVQICVTEVPFSLSPTIFSTALRHSNCYYLVPMDNKFFQIRLTFSSKKCT